MKRLTLLAATVALAAGCATTSDQDIAAKGDAYALDPTDENVRCERYKPIGSNMTERRCYVVGSEEDRAREQQDAELRRRTSRVPGTTRSGG